MRNVYKILLFFVFFLGSVSISFSQNTSTQGKVFWLSYMFNGFQEHPYGGFVNTKVLISAKRSCSGTITNPNTGYSQSFSVTAGNVTLLDIPNLQAYHDGSQHEMVTNKGIKITATDTISVYSTNHAYVSFDASFVLPVESLGEDYIIQCCDQSVTPYGNEYATNNETTAFVIVATENNTIVDITPTVNTLSGKPANVQFSVTLNAGQTYHVRSSRSSQRDLSGTRVTARDCKKIAVFNGNTLTCVPTNQQNGFDHVYEQAMPLRSWGRKFVVTNSNTRNRDFVKIVSSANNDTIWKNGVFQTVLQYKQCYSFWLSNTEGSCYLQTSKRSAVYLYNNSSYDQSYAGGNGDPSMVWIAPVEQKIKEITFSTFNYTGLEINNHYVNIVVDAADYRRVTLDGVTVTGFLPVAGNPNFRYVRKEIQHGAHRLVCPNGFNAHVYGFGQARGYAYLVGSNAVDLTTSLTINNVALPHDDTLEYCVHQPVRFFAEVMANNPSYYWQFGDGSTSHSNPAFHTYNNKAIYNARLIVTTTESCNEGDVDTVGLVIDVRQKYVMEYPEVCAGDEYVSAKYHKNFIVNNDTTVAFTFPNENNTRCFDSVLLYIRANRSFHDTLYREVCWDGKPGSFNEAGFNIYYTRPGFFTSSHIDETTEGCDSVTVVQLNVRDRYIAPDEQVSTCKEMYEWNGNVYTESGVYVDTMKTVWGCDSILTLSLSMHPTYDMIVHNDSICLGDTYNENGLNVPAAEIGPFDTIFPLVSVFGCDSAVTLHLEILPSQYLEFDTVVCDSLVWDGGVYSESGLFERLYENQFGCDSTFAFNLTVNHKAENRIRDAVCQGDEYDAYNFHLPTDSTQIPHTIILQDSLFTVDGCDSIVTLEITINEIVNVLIEDSVCQGNEYHDYHFLIPSDSTSSVKILSVVDTLASVTGCDSIVQLLLKVNPVYDTTFFEEICQTTPFSDYGFDTIFTPEATLIYDTLFLKSDKNCDSTVYLELLVRPVYDILISDTICQFEAYQQYGFDTIADVSGMIFDTLFLQTVNACDSIVHLELTVQPSYDTVIRAAICQYETYDLNGFDTVGLSANTIFDTLVLQTVNNCDSLVFLELTVYPVIDTLFVDTICQKFTYQEHGFDIYADSVGWCNQTLNLISQHGCDSTIRLELLINPTYDTVYHRDSICQGETYTGYGVVDYFAEIAGTITFTWDTLESNVYGCDSLALFELIVLPVYALDFYDTVCQGDFYTEHGFSFTVADAGAVEDSIHYQTLAGCDSTHYLHLTVNPIFDTTFYEEICQTIPFAGHGFDAIQTPEAGIIYDTLFLQSAHNCDSIVYLELTVHPIYDTTFYEEICQTTPFSAHGFGTIQTPEVGMIYDTLFLQSIHNCDSLVYLELTVLPIFDTTFYEEICQTTPFSAHGFGTIQTPDAGMIYDTLFLQSVHNCDSIVYLELTVHPIFDTTFHEDICRTTPFCDHGFDTIQTPEIGIIYDTLFLQSIHNCDSTVYLELTVHQIYDTIFREEICQTTPYTGHGFTAVPTPEAGMTYDTLFLQSIHNCDSIVYLELTVHPVFDTTFYESTCQHTPYVGHGFDTVPATQFGIVHQTRYLQSEYGCDSIVNLELAVHPVYSTTFHEEICHGAPYVGHGFDTIQTPNLGLIVDTLVMSSLFGCDSINILELNVNEVYDTNEFVTACWKYAWGGNDYYVSGIYDSTFSTAAGCDSTVTLHLTINPIYADTISDTTCRYTPYEWFGQTVPTENAGIQYASLNNTSVLGCDSITTLRLTVLELDSTGFEVTACDEYIWNDSVFTQTTIYTDILPSHFQCDSIVTMVLTIYPTTDTTIYLGGCDSLTWEGQTYMNDTTLSGILTNQYGCDSLLTVHIGISHSEYYTTQAVGCGYVTWEMDTIYQSGTYEYPHQNQFGCDSTITVDVEIHELYNDTLYGGTLCQGEPFTWNGMDIPTVVLDTVFATDSTLQSIHGCDSIVTMYFEVVGGQDTLIQLFGCDSLAWNGMTYTETTSEIFEHTGQNGCDSLVHLEVNVAYTTNDTIIDEICQYEPYYFDSIQVPTTIPGLATITLMETSQQGCDSIVTLQLEVLPVYNTTERIDACGSFELNGTTYMSDTLLSVTFSTIDGCDSIVQTDIHIWNDTTIHLIDLACQGEPYEGFGFVMETDSVGTFVSQRVITGLYGCDTIIELTLTVHPTHEVERDTAVCGLLVYGGNQITESGDYSFNEPTQFGCDSIITLHVTVYPVSDILIEEEICQLDTYIGNGLVFVAMEVGEFEFDSTMQSQFGCDSTVRLKLVVHPTWDQVLYDTTCYHVPYYANGFSNEAENVGEELMTKLLSTQYGCDSTVILHLQVMPSYSDTIEAKICAEEQYEGYNFIIPPMGIGEYWATMNTPTSLYGCDSITTLHLEVGDISTGEFSIDTCTSYEWLGEAFVSSGNYVRTLENQYGCDSVVTLTLKLSYLPMVGEIHGTEWANVSVDLHHGIYDYFIDEVEGATGYEWFVDNPYWLVTYDGNMAKVTVRTEGSATLTVRVYNGCGFTEVYQRIHAVFTGVGEDLENLGDVSIRPNPTKGKLTIGLEGMHGETLVEVYDAAGNKVDSFTVMAAENAEFEYSIANLARGLYLFNIRNEGHLFIRKVIRE